jgi:ribose transport system ATP-binding protein
MDCLLEMRNICKEFNGNRVLDRVNFSVAPGQVCGLVGENGAGKTTLMKILAGTLQPDSGELVVSGVKTGPYNPKIAQEMGISMIYQETGLFPDLNVGENIFIRREPMRRWRCFARIDWEQVYRETRKYLDYFGLPFSPKTPVDTLSPGHQKFVEIIKAMAHQAQVMIMDEPTATLTESEIELLFKAVRDMKQQGVSTVFISHRLEEVIRIADRITILRDGAVVQTCATESVSLNHIVKMMAGKAVEDRYPKLPPKLGKEMMRVENLGFENRIRAVSFDVRKGEILGITGLSGAGKRTLAKTLFGINRSYTGTILIEGKPVKITSPRVAIENGICYVAGVGNREALLPAMSIVENITITNLERVARHGILLDKQELENAGSFAGRLEIRENPRELAGNLSGGNQKKIGLAKWLFANSRILIFEEPTSGIDISSKVDIYNILTELVRSGASVLMISSDLPELLGMCDRVIVMYNGEIRRIFPQAEATKEKILYYASGGDAEMEETDK